MDYFVTILVAILTLGILVLIHELGHFLVARYFKIKVLEFGFGLPPRAWGKKIGETIYSLNWLPFGGFVHLLGEDDTNPEVLKDSRSFAHQNLFIRSAVVIAGVTMNLVLAIILYTVVLASQNFQTELPLLNDHHFVGVEQSVKSAIIVQSVTPDSPAAKAGLLSEDRIVSADNQPLSTSQDLIKLAKERAGQPITLSLERGPSLAPQSVTLTPRTDPPAGQGPMGVSLSGFKTVRLKYSTIPQKVFSGFIHSYNLASYSIDVIRSLASTSIAEKTTAPISQGVSGPIGIFQIVGVILKTGDLRIYLDFMAALSLNLAVVNLLPFPGLDGGRLAFFLVEFVTRKKPHPTFEKYVHSIGLIILLAMIVLVTASDLRKIF